MIITIIIELSFIWFFFYLSAKYHTSIWSLKFTARGPRPRSPKNTFLTTSFCLLYFPSTVNVFKLHVFRSVKLEFWFVHRLYAYLRCVRDMSHVCRTVEPSDNRALTVSPIKKNKMFLNRIVLTVFMPKLYRRFILWPIVSGKTICTNIINKYQYNWL